MFYQPFPQAHGKEGVLVLLVAVVFVLFLVVRDEPSLCLLLLLRYSFYLLSIFIVVFSVVAKLGNKKPA